MTQPEQSPKDLAEIEEEAATAASASILADIAIIMTLLAAVWPADPSNEREMRNAIARLNVARIIQRIPEAQAEIERALSVVTNYATKQAVAMTRDAGVAVRRIKAPEPTPAVQALVAHVETVVIEQVNKAQVLLNQSKTMAQAKTAINVARAAATRIEATAKQAVNQSANETISAIDAKYRKTKLIWQPERNACVHCLAYAGKERDNEGNFPEGLTYGNKPLTTKAVPNPPLHPNCRCQLIIVSKDDKATGEALEREAKRSVLRGWSVESESKNTRLAAAERLLKTETSLPKSVKQYARTSIKEGRFPRGRVFPD